MAGDYIPGPDIDLGHWAKNFISYVQEHAEEMGVDPSTVNALLVDQSDFDSEYEAYRDALVHATARLRAKNHARKRLVSRLRSVAQVLQARPDTTDAQRVEMGLFLRTRRETAFSEVPESTPVPDISIPGRTAHEIRMYSKTSAGMKKARPAGAVGCELWRTIGERPNAGAQMEYVGLITKASFLVRYGGEHAGQMAHYQCRWIDRQGNPGPWSKVYSVTITA